MFQLHIASLLPAKHLIDLPKFIDLFTDELDYNTFGSALYRSLIFTEREKMHFDDYLDYMIQIELIKSGKGRFIKVNFQDGF